MDLSGTSLLRPLRLVDSGNGSQMSQKAEEKASLISAPMGIFLFRFPPLLFLALPHSKSDLGAAI